MKRIITLSLILFFSLFLNKADAQLKAFTLLAPPDSAIIAVEGSPETTHDVTWNSSSALSTYTWLAILPGGNFGAPLLSIPSNNAGIDTMVTFSNHELDSVLNALGVVQGASATLIWTVEADSAGTTQLADTSYVVTLERGEVMAPFDLTSPADSATLITQGLASTQVPITWQNASDSASYLWQIDVAGNNFSNPIAVIPSPTNSLTVTFADIDDLLAANGVAVGDSIQAIWKVDALYAGDTLSSTSTFSAKIIRGVTLADFNLLAPSNNAIIPLYATAGSNAVISWNSSGDGASYMWMADLATGNLSAPILTSLSDNSGADTTLTLPIDSLNSLLGNLGVAIGDTANLIWTVSSFSTTDTVYSLDTFAINLVRGVTLNAFNLTSPPNGTTAFIDGSSSNTISATWSPSSDSLVSYEWQLQSQFGSFANPLVSITTTDTFVDVRFDTIRNRVFTSQATPINGTFNGKWRVRATAGSVTRNSATNRNLSLTRGIILDDFSLTAPANNTALNLSGLGSTQVVVDWTSAGIATTYTWYLMTVTNDTVLVVPNINTDSLILTYEQIDLLLESNGIPIGANAPLMWDITTESINDTLASTNGPFNISITRGDVVRDITQLTPANNTNLDLFGIASKTVDITWTKSSQNITYEWQFDTAGANFSNPILSVANGTDTSITYTYAQLEAVMASQGLQVGGTGDFIWRVVATNGTDTLFKNAFNLTINRFPLISNFDLKTPGTGAALTVEGSSANTLTPEWESASMNGASYQWIFDTLGGNFNSPLIIFDADTMGLDSSRTILFGTLDTFLMANGIGINGVFSGQWTARAIVLDDTLQATSVNTVDLTRGSVMYPFGLATPSDNAGVAVEGLNTDLITATWHPAKDTLTTYQWFLDTTGGNFTSPLVSISTGTDTSVSLDMSTVNNLLVSLGVAYNDFQTFEWYVEAYTGGDTLASSDIFSVSLSRGTVLEPFNQLTPSNNTTLLVEGDGKQTVTISWQDASPDGRPVYEWLIDAPGNAFVAPLASVVSDNNGNDTTLTLNYTEIDGLLATLGANIGDTVTAIWSARASGGFKSLLATNNPYTITLIRGDVINPFDLLTPGDPTIVNVTGDENKTADISWTSAGLGNINYDWKLDVIGGNFTNPITSIPSANSGSDTTLSIPFGDIETLLINNGLNIGDTLKAIWDVEASNSAGNAFSANGPYEVWFIRGSVIRAFDLTAPANNTRLLVEGDATTPVNITWQSAGNGNYTYEWQLDLPGGNFSPPIASVDADNNGTSNSLSLDYAAVDNLLASLGLALGDSVDAIWTVRATEGTDVITAQSSYDIRFIRGALTVPFILTGPADGSIMTVAGNSTQNLNISWTNADYKGSTNSLNYTWLLDNPSGDFSAPVASMMSDNGGKGTSLTLPFSDIWTLLDNNGVAVGAQADFIWTVEASLLSLSEFPSESFDISFIKAAENVSVEDNLQEASVQVYPNPSNGNLTLDLNANVNGNAQIEIIDVIGKTVHTENRAIVNGKNLLFLNLQQLTNGFYFVKVTTPEGVLEQRISITR